MKDLYLSKCWRTCKLNLVFYSTDQFITFNCSLVKIKSWSWEIFREVSDEIITFVTEIFLLAGNVEFRAYPTWCLLGIHHKFGFPQEKWKLRRTKIHTTLFVSWKSTFEGFWKWNVPFWDHYKIIILKFGHLC